MQLQEFGERIKEYRLKKGLTQEELAKKLFVSRKTVSKWETGRGLPDSSMLPHIAEALGVTIDELFDGKAEEIADFYRDFHEKVDEHALYIKSYEKQRAITVVWKVLSLALAVVVIILAATTMSFKKKYESTFTTTKYTLAWRDYTKSPYVAQSNFGDWQTQTFTDENWNGSFVIQADPYACILVVLQKAVYDANGKMIRHTTVESKPSEMFIDGKQGQVFDVYPNDYYLGGGILTVNYEEKFGRPEGKTYYNVCRTPGVHYISYGSLLYLRVDIPTPDDRQSLTMRYTTTTGESVSTSATVVDPYIVQREVTYKINNYYHVLPVLTETSPKDYYYTRGKIEFLQWKEGVGDEVVYTVDLENYYQEEAALSEWLGGGTLSVIHKSPISGLWERNLARCKDCVYPVRIELIGSPKFRDRVLYFNLYVK